VNLIKILNSQAIRRTLTMKYSSKLTAAICVMTSTGFGQIVLTGSAPTYSENFDTLTRSTTAETWTNNGATTSASDSPRVVGLVGWYTGSFGTTTTTPQIRAGTGSNTAGSFYSFGASAASDRALGTMPSDTSASASMRLGVRFVNNTGFTITGFNFSYDGEQWRKASLASATNNQYVVAYSIFDAGTGSLQSASYSANISSAEFNTPIDGGDSVSAALDGNDSVNRIAGLSGSISSTAITPGQELWIRWFDSNSSGADHGIAIDNFSVNFTTAIPEPSTFAALAGLGVIGLALCRRRRARA
jgi:hypothetical protein